MKRPLGVTLLAVLMIFVAACSFAYLLWSFGAGQLLPESASERLESFFGERWPAGWLLQSSLVAITAVCLVFAWGLWTLRNWARRIVIIISAVRFLETLLVQVWLLVQFAPYAPYYFTEISLLGVTNLFVIAYLLRPSVKHAFGVMQGSAR